MELKSGETKTVSFELDFRASANYHPKYHQWITEDGKFNTLIRASSADLTLSNVLRFQRSTQTMLVDELVEGYLMQIHGIDS